MPLRKLALRLTSAAFVSSVTVWPLAIFASAFSGGLPNSPYSDIAVACVDVVGLVLLGWFLRWQAVWLFPLALIIVSIVHEQFFFHDDPQLSGMDDIGPTGILLFVPVVVPFLVGVVLLQRRSSTPRL